MMPGSSGLNQDGDAYSYPSQFMNIKDIFDFAIYVFLGIWIKVNDSYI